jgi:glycosyltransferase involved in cell wall biosynthesis
MYFFIHHIWDEEYKKAFPFPLNWIFTRFVFWTFSRYKNLPTITVSDSTATELREQHGFTNISIVENATHLKPINSIDWKSKNKEIVFYGRLTRMKRADHAIRAFDVLAKSNSEYQMNIIWNAQDTDYTEELHILVDALWLSDRVHFLWFSHDIVAKYLPRAEIMLVPSTKEWYGLIVLEWNCFGLPVIAYDVPGLRDSVRNNANWLLVEDWDYNAMGTELIELINNREKLTSLWESSLSFIKDFGWWDERYTEFKKIILK